MNNYNNIQEGALGMLYECVSLLNELQVKYIVVGGWSSYLLNSSPIKHPGTRDVDVLFDRGYEKGRLKEIIIEFLKKGFILSAKHEFQIFKEIEVRGKPFIYNMDLLHPLETQNPGEIYVEHIEFDIPADKYLSDNFKMKSIALPNSQILFDSELFTMHRLSTQELPSLEFPLMDEIGTLLTKSQSVQIKKRFRDSLDIYLAITQNTNHGKFIAKLKRLKDKRPGFFNNLYGIREAFEKGTLYSNSIKYHEFIKSTFDDTIQTFIKDIGLDKLATH